MIAFIVVLIGPVLLVLLDRARGAAAASDIGARCGVPWAVTYRQNWRKSGMRINCALSFCPSPAEQQKLSCVEVNIRRRGYALSDDFCIGECAAAGTVE